MIVDFHTHIFPPEVIAQRERYVREDATFRLLYENPQANLATAKDLLESMDAAGIDVSVAVGFAWSDPETCRLHNDYLIKTAETSSGRIVGLCSLPLGDGIEAIEMEMRRCTAQGVRGFGELRPDNAGFALNGAEGNRLAELAQELDTLLLFHVSEPVGHAYAGKEGLDVGAFYRFVAAHPDVVAIGAHWAGGLPFYASMPEVRRAFQANVYVDTAATSLLYDDGVYERVADLIGARRILFGSDYPLLSQKRSRQRIEASGLDDAATALILGDNAMRLLQKPGQ